MLQESKRAYMQLDDNCKSLVEKLQNEKNNAIKQFEKTYQSKIKCKFFPLTVASPWRDSEALKATAWRLTKRHRCFRSSKNRSKTWLWQLALQPWTETAKWAIQEWWAALEAFRRHCIKALERKRRAELKAQIRIQADDWQVQSSVGLDC